MADITITIATDAGQRWTLTHSNGKEVASNFGQATVRNVPDGDYTIAWSTVPGYDPPYPASEQKTITGSGSFASPTYSATTTNITAIWANDGSDKVTQDDLRTLSGSVINHVWDGTNVTISGATNEVVSFSLYLESEVADSVNVEVALTQLDERGVGTDQITSATRTTAQLYEWAGSPIEMFVVGYLPILGLSYVSYADDYDERHIPERMRRPFELTLDPARGTPLAGFENWSDRPDADKAYPDILVPHEAQPQFTIAAGTVQQVWCDIYIPKGLTAGIYDGTISITEDSGTPVTVPIELTVHDFELPDTSTAQAMIYIADYDINRRHYGTNYPSSSPESADTRDNYVKLLHRHRMGVVGDERGHLASWGYDAIPSWWSDRLDGTLFSAATNYDGPGKDVGNGMFAIGMYADWRYPWSADQTTGKPTQSELQTELNAWATIWSNYDTANPTQPVERFVYLGDEPNKPKGLWNLSGIAGGTPTADNFTVDGATKNASRSFRIHEDALGIYTTTAGRVLQSLTAGNRIIVQREDDPQNQYAVYELTVDAVEETTGVAYLANCTHIESAGAANFAATEDWRISGGAKDVLYYYDIAKWATWAQSTGVNTFTTVPWDEALLGWGVPDVSHPAHPLLFRNPTTTLSTRNTLNADGNRLSVVYNGQRPLSGSFATEDDGVAMVTLPWIQYKLEIDWWFYWNSTYFYNYGSSLENRLFEEAHTFGVYSVDDPAEGRSGGPSGRYSNSDGVLLYPGTDTVYPASSLGINGPVASIRLKMWRRGIQDVEYVVAAKAASPGSIAAIDAIVDAAIPQGIWEYGVADTDDPGYQYTDISWSTDPEAWQTKRNSLVTYAEA